MVRSSSGPSAGPLLALYHGSLNVWGLTSYVWELLWANNVCYVWEFSFSSLTMDACAGEGCSLSR